MATSAKPIFHKYLSQSSGDSVEHSPRLLVSTNTKSCANCPLYPKTCETTNDTSLVAFKAGSKHGERNAKMSGDPKGLGLPKQGSPRFAPTSLSSGRCVVGRWQKGPRLMNCW